MKVSIKRIGDEVEIVIEDGQNGKHFNKRIPLYQAQLLGKMLAQAGIQHEHSFKFSVEVSE